ncbi:DUF4376 domain-containing protein [Escherichia coli]|nr:DUF4376 domain-containing protein [Escherichia coli]EFB4494744.1 DUF4376 domain-containing protein [Escherichia coli]EFF2242631.1 DUF4376 domain-containing protein [Escherichia coli]EFF2312802.1 DUF4376 domain-containing protein [Escherichia coli]EFK2571179.1 DUF4376 domain-containing protein [Escherichia coli]EFO3172936.1 DUF4376 domain-containing protein [Escherichia coli]
MTRYAYYHPVTFEVIDWIDAASFTVELPDSVIPVDDEQWQLKDKPCWICLDPFKIITTPPPDNFYILEDDKWVYNKTLFTVALENTKAQVTQEIKNRRDEITVDCIIINNHHFHSDTNSRIQQLSLTKMGAEKKIPPGLMWKTKNNGLIELTNEIAAQFESVTMDHDMRLFANAQHHIAAVEALDDIQAVLDYDYSTG